MYKATFFAREGNTHLLHIKLKTINIKHINKNEAHQCNKKIKFSTDRYQSSKEQVKSITKIPFKTKKQAHNPPPTTHNQTMHRNVNMNTSDEWPTAVEIKNLEEMLEHTIGKEERKELEERIKVAQVAHKTAILAIALTNSTGARLCDDDTMETEIIDLDHESDKDTEMTNAGANAKRVSGSPGTPLKKTRTTLDKTNAQEERSKTMADGWNDVPPGGCNGDGVTGHNRNNNSGKTVKGTEGPVRIQKHSKQITSLQQASNNEKTPAATVKAVTVTQPDTSNTEKTPAKAQSAPWTQLETSGAKTTVQGNVQNGNETSETRNAVHNPYAKPLSFAAALGNENEIGTEIITSNTIRLRFAFKGNQNDTTANGQADEIKRVLKELVKTLKTVDQRSKILQWETPTTGDKGIGDREIPHLSPAMAKKYFDIPTYIKDFGVGRMNHRIGLRVATDMKLREFLDTWNGLKPKGNSSWMSVQPAEMQKSPKFFAVAFLQGSSEKKDTTTINANISAELGVEAEISWQYLKQDGITNNLWDLANAQATKLVGKNSKQYNKVKFSWAPAALVVYVANKADVKIAKRMLLQKYGKEVDEMWPAWCDGSRMKCVPLIQGRINNERAKDQIGVRMKWQVFSKANEVTLELPLKDIHAQKAYMNGRSLEQVLLGTMADSNEKLSLFKHITHKYNRNPLYAKYQVTVYKSLETEAIRRLEEMKDVLHSQFGNDILHHFDNQHKGLQYSHSNRREHQAEEFDQETEDWLLSDCMTEKEGCLEPGFKDFIEFDPTATTSDSTIHHGDTTRASSDASNNSTIGTTSTLNTNISNVTGISWVEGIKDNNATNTTEDWRESTRIQKKLDAVDITSNELRKWKEDNAEAVKMLTIANSGVVYNTMKQIIKCMTAEKLLKKQQQHNDNVNPTGADASDKPGGDN